MSKDISNHVSQRERLNSSPRQVTEERNKIKGGREGKKEGRKRATVTTFRGKNI